MNIYELAERVGAQFVSNKVVLVEGQKRTVLAKHDGADFTLTSEGVTLSKQLHETEIESAVKESAPKKRRGRPKAAPVETSEPDTMPDIFEDLSDVSTD